MGLEGESTLIILCWGVLLRKSAKAGCCSLSRKSLGGLEMQEWWAAQRGWHRLASRHWLVPLVYLGNGNTTGKREGTNTFQALRRKWERRRGHPPGAAAFGRMGWNQQEAEQWERTRGVPLFTFWGSEKHWWLRREDALEVGVGRGGKSSPPSSAHWAQAGASSGDCLSERPGSPACPLGQQSAAPPHHLHSRETEPSAPCSGASPQPDSLPSLSPQQGLCGSCWVPGGRGWSP